jgi:hypothetical protein
MKRCFIPFLMLLIVLGLAWGMPASLFSAERCEEVVENLNQALQPKIDPKELFVVLKVLNETDNQRLPPKFVTKEQARKLGWNPGSNLWGYDRLKGKSIGGDVFGNREGKLPNGKRGWREADLDYKAGGKHYLFRRRLRNHWITKTFGGFPRASKTSAERVKLAEIITSRLTRDRLKLHFGLLRAEPGCAMGCYHRYPGPGNCLGDSEISKNPWKDFEKVAPC